jgi:hypothetical protein
MIGASNFTDLILVMSNESAFTTPIALQVLNITFLTLTQRPEVGAPGLYLSTLSYSAEAATSGVFSEGFKLFCLTTS